MAILTGKLIGVLPEQSGEKDGKQWFRGGFVIQTIDNEFPRTVAFTVFGVEMCNLLKTLKTNETLLVTYRPESHEYGLKWYTDLRCSRIQTLAK